ncbi:replication initiator protein [Apis mellifera associated microvirus 11]|nr:replication initiator protein [Apis mellifera associated microvirus 11]AZL82774.1 replication initiator protein [Apis mellifera associated microvirus 11]
MPCLAPIRAARHRTSGGIRFHDPPDYQESYERVALPCGRCVGCRRRRAQEWTLRNVIEFGRHAAASFVTLTYDDANCPPTLSPRDLSLYLKRLRRRSNGGVRFFACGEYGDRTKRPHYHALLYGLPPTDPAIKASWRFGLVDVGNVTPASIAYTCGYVTKKYTSKRWVGEVVDPDTGEVIKWQPPFLQMSRNPGIGAHAREFTSAWRSHAVLPGGIRQPVPRYFHQAWVNQASDQELEALVQERIAGIMERAADLPDGWQDAARARYATREEHITSKKGL